MHTTTSSAPTPDAEPGRDTSRLRSRALRAAVAGIISLGLVLSASPAFAGKLSRVRNAVKSGQRTSSSSYGGGGGGGSADDAWLALQIVASPWWLPHYALDDRFGTTFAYLPHPYAHNSDGYVQRSGRDRGVRAGQGRRLLGQATSIRASVEGGLVDQNLTRFTVAGRISGNHRFEIETKWDSFTESLGGGALDQIWLGDVNVTWQHAVGRHGQFRTGVGLRTMVDVDGTTDHGVNFTYGFDLYPASPLVVHAAIDVGTVGQAGFVQANGALGLMVGALELYVGYDQTWVGDVDLGGPMVGVRMWR